MTKWHKPKTMNALQHGYYARDVLLPWESREDFEQLHADLRDELQPDGRMEEEIVFDITHLRWQKQRIRKMWHAATYGDPFVIDIVESGEKSWSGIRSYLRSQANDVRTLTGSLSGAHSRLFQELKKLGGIPVKKDLEKSEIDKMLATITVMSEHLLPLLQKLENGPGAENTLRSTYSPEYLEPIIRLEAAVDARIDKQLGQFVSLKEFKRLAGNYQKPRQIPASQPKTASAEEGSGSVVDDLLFE